MDTLISVVVVVLLVAACVAARLLFTFRRRVDARTHTASSEERAALLSVQGDIDRGRAARQGFIPM